MTLKTIPLAIAYDFDGTLAPGYMQDHRFIPDLGMPRNEFWAEVNRIKARDNADPVLAYMGHMLHMAAAAGVDVRRSDLRAWGADLPLFSGLPEWFSRITAFAADRGVDARHYVISSGNTEIIEGTGLADAVDDVFASAFKYDENGRAVWPSRAVSYTNKTQFLFRINKGCHAAHDEVEINRFVPENERPVPFENMAFIGDGDTDVPCMSMLNRMGGASIAVYDKAKGDAVARRLVRDGRAQAAVPADYEAGSLLEREIHNLVERVRTRRAA
jgi:phosphoserine phosphatase